MKRTNYIEFISYFIIAYAFVVIIPSCNSSTKFSEEQLSDIEELKKSIRFISQNLEIEKNEVLEIDGFSAIMTNQQYWMINNLKNKVYCNGDSIPEIKSTKEWRDAKIGAWCYYNNDPKYGEMFGKLYNWYAVNDSRGLCPCGWRVASDQDWTNLVNYYGGKYASVAFIKSDTSWENGFSGNNLSGFNALPGGFRPTPEGGGEDKNDFDGLSGGVWWSSSRAEAPFNLNFLNKTAWGLDVCWDNTYRANDGWFVGKSVRCVKDIISN
jgi:uncharacterized protein (TIGR02145 family)